MTKHHAYIGPLHVRLAADPAYDDHGCGSWVIDPNEPIAEELAEMLRGHARGEYGWEAAIELLVAHGRWLQSREFRSHVDAFLAYTRPGAGPDTPRAVVGWADLAESIEHGDLTGSGSELDMLRIACSLASVESRVSLRAVLSSLDDQNSWLVTKAVAHASGYRQEWCS